MSTASLDAHGMSSSIRTDAGGLAPLAPLAEDTGVPLSESDLFRAKHRQPASMDKPVETTSPLKYLGKAAGLVRALPHLLCYGLGLMTMGKEKAFRSSSERIAAVPGMLGVYARQWFYMVTLKEVGDDVYFGYMSMFSKPDVIIGDRVFIGRFCSIGWADLGDEAMLADGVQVLSGRHHHGGAGEQGVQRENTFTKVVVGTRAWIGANAVVMSHVGEEAIIGAGAVVTKMVYERQKVAGVPARPLRVEPVARAA